MTEAFISRGFRGRRPAAPITGRLPPGQYETRDFPVLSAGPTPRTSLATWDFTVCGADTSQARWTWDEFQARLHETVRRVAAVFDHRGDATGDPMAPVYESLNILEELGKTDHPSRHTAFFNVWEGKDRNLEEFREALRDDLESVFGMVAAGQLQPAIAATYPLAQAADALRYAESGQAVGKVILVP